MIEARSFIEAARDNGFGLYSGVPCSFLKPFINYVIDSDDLRYVGAANEGQAVAIAAGAELGGLRSVAMFQNSGLGNAVSPLTSLTHPFKVPVLLIPTLRGDPDAAPDEPQHELIGEITTGLLEMMQIPWAYFPSNEADIGPALAQAVAHMESNSRPYALVMRKGSVAPTELETEPNPVSPVSHSAPPLVPTGKRQDMLRAIQAASLPDDVIVATTGYAGRELYACEDRPNQFYMVGSMGCASSLGLGLAIACPDRRIIVIDGDGAALMHLGALCTIGHERPTNLLHILLDNGIHESTGGQATVSHSIDFCAIAAASGYPHTFSVATPEDLSAEIAERREALSFLHVPIFPGVFEKLSRPTITPADVAERLRKFLGAEKATR